MTIDRLTYTDLFNFDDHWYVREGYNHRAKTTFHVISCPHILIRKGSPVPWYPSGLDQECKYCGPVPDEVLIVYKMLTK